MSSQLTGLRLLLTRALLSLLTSVLLIFSFPSFDYSWLAWIALVALLIALHRCDPLSAAAYGLLAGCGFFAGLFAWMRQLAGFQWSDFLLCDVYLGAYFALFSLVLTLLLRRTRLSLTILAPPVWVAMEYLRMHVGFGFLGVPWGLLGHTQYQQLSLIQIASLTGVYGVSFLICLVNAVLCETFLLARKTAGESAVQRYRSLLTSACLTTVLLGLSLIYGAVVVARPHAQAAIRLTVVQGNIVQEVKWRPESRHVNLDTYVALTRAAVQAEPSTLIVWPETAIPGTLTHDLFVSDTIARLAKEIQTPLLIGSLHRPSFGSRDFRATHHLNTASLISPVPRIVGRYAKTHLLPFGEYLPYREAVPWPERVIARLNSWELIPGEESTVFDLNGQKFGVLICWESLFPELARRLVNNGASFLINMTNEAWFGETTAPYQFLAMSVFRAVENRVAVIRSANTGVSGFIDPHGRITGRVQGLERRDIFVSGYLTQEVSLAGERTLYTTYGDLWAYLNIAVAGGLFLLPSLRIGGR